MVLDAACCVLHNRHDAEDVYQATFLVLARKAASIRKQASLASWLYGVAYRLAKKARTSAAKRHNCEEQKTSEVSQTSEVFRNSVMDEMTWREFRLILHEELQRLPKHFQAPLLLCYLEGKTRDEAAKELAARGLNRIHRRISARKINDTVHGQRPRLKGYFAGEVKRPGKPEQSIGGAESSCRW